MKGAEAMRTARDLIISKSQSIKWKGGERKGKEPERGRKKEKRKSKRKSKRTEKNRKKKASKHASKQAIERVSKPKKKKR